MISFLSVAILFGILWVVGYLLGIAITSVQCGKQGWWSSFPTAFIWALFPTLVYALVSYFTYLQGIFSGGIKTILGWTGMIADDSSYDLIGLCYALVLTGLMVTTWMIYSLDVSVCKPTTDELNEFSFNHIRELHEKNKAESK
jgi:hypothetical protein